MGRAESYRNYPTLAHTHNYVGFPSKKPRQCCDFYISISISLLEIGEGVGKTKKHQILQRYLRYSFQHFHFVGMLLKHCSLGQPEDPENIISEVYQGCPKLTINPLVSFLQLTLSYPRVNKEHRSIKIHVKFWPTALQLYCL